LQINARRGRTHRAETAVGRCVNDAWAVSETGAAALETAALGKDGAIRAAARHTRADTKAGRVSGGDKRPEIRLCWQRRCKSRRLEAFCPSFQGARTRAWSMFVSNAAEIYVLT
jgi:hypothetical protein